MKRATLLFAACLLAIGACRPCDCRAQCWGESYSPGQATFTGGAYEWKEWVGDPGRLYLYYNGRQIGAYDIPSDCYRAYWAQQDAWAGPSRPPVALPPFATRVENFGVDMQKIKSNETSYYFHDGQADKITAANARNILEKKLEDDSKKLRVTVIGDKQTRKKVAKEIASEKGLQDWAIVRDYAPDSWVVKTGGMVSTGSPTIYCQAPGTGKVLHRQDDYKGGQAAAIEALRKAKSAYDAKEDPDRRHGAGPMGFDLFWQCINALLGVFSGGTLSHLATRRL